MAKARSFPYLDAYVPNRENAYLIIRERLDELYSWESYADDPNNVRELHNLRIAAKRLRYSLEIFEDVLPAESVALRGEVEKIQEELGDLHDSDVLGALLRLCLSPGGREEGDAVDEGPGVLREMQREKLDLPEALLSCLLDPQTIPEGEERRGLELLLNDVVHEREAQYAVFQRHWHELKACDYRQAVLVLFDSGTGKHAG